MTILELFYNVDKVSDIQIYGKEYLYWSVDDNNKYILLDLKENKDIFLDVDKDDKGIKYDIINLSIDYDWNEEFPRFIPYDQIRRLDKIYIEFEGKVWYESSQRNPLVCVRGICDQKCTANKLDYLYCFHDIPCTDKRPDWNCWTGKWPNFYDLIIDIVRWIEVCRHMDTLVVMFEYPPNTCLESECCLAFDYSIGLLIKDNHITVLSDSKVRTLYEEYNKKYPTRDREIEESINWEDTEFKFYF
jgi:hypothetical protein